MEMRERRLVIFILGALFLSCIFIWSAVLAPTPASVKNTVEAVGERVLGAAGGNVRTRVLAMLAAQPEEFSLPPRTKSSGCAVNGSYPDRACTPGAVFAGVGTSTICVSGYTKTVRNVPTKLRQQIYRAYGIAYPQPTGSYELDHFIPLALGGDNGAANLFPEAAEPKPGFKEKDVVEVYLYEEVCAGHLPLPQAQMQIASDWLLVYNAIEQSEVSRIKQKYRNWSN